MIRDAFNVEVFVGDEVWTWQSKDILEDKYLPVKVKIDNILPREILGHLSFIAEDTNNNKYDSNEICSIYVPKTKSINKGDHVAYYNLLGSISKGIVYDINKGNKIVIYTGLEEGIDDAVEELYMCHKEASELVKLSDSKKSVIQAVKEFKE
jgi:hypothetical protein